MIKSNLPQSSIFPQPQLLTKAAALSRDQETQVVASGCPSLPQSAVLQNASSCFFQINKYHHHFLLLFTISKTILRHMCTHILRRMHVRANRKTPTQNTPKWCHYLPWSVAKQSMMSMLSHRACWSSWDTRDGQTFPRPPPRRSASAAVRKRWCGVTSHVTGSPFSLAARTTKICQNSIIIIIITNCAGQLQEKIKLKYFHNLFVKGKQNENIHLGHLTRSTVCVRNR